MSSPENDISWPALAARIPMLFPDRNKFSCNQGQGVTWLKMASQESDGKARVVSVSCSMKLPLAMGPGSISVKDTGEKTGMVKCE
jgi:hypothetical protein